MGQVAERPKHADTNVWDLNLLHTPIRERKRERKSTQSLRFFLFYVVFYLWYLSWVAVRNAMVHAILLKQSVRPPTVNTHHVTVHLSISYNFQNLLTALYVVRSDPQNISGAC